MSAELQKNSTRGMRKGFLFWDQEYRISREDILKINWKLVDKQKDSIWLVFLVISETFFDGEGILLPSMYKR